MHWALLIILLVVCWSVADQSTTNTYKVLSIGSIVQRVTTQNGASV